jgi:zinc protease
MTSRIRASLLACALGIATGAQASVAVHTLANGMKVYVKEDHRAPVVVSQVWYRAGAIDELTGTTGVAHVLEHMMFKGTKDVPAGQFSKRIAAAGGRENAFTSRDHTAYFQTLQKDRLELALKLEADRMANLDLSDEAFAKEIHVVMEERRMRTEDSPQALVYEALMATAYQAHPYRNPIIGWMNDLEGMTAEDARDWYRRWYAPNNTALVVAGDVNPDEVVKLAEQYFGPLAARELPSRKPHAEPAQRGEKRIVVKAPAELPYVLMAWHAPALRDPANDSMVYALQVLAGVLDGFDAARLPQRLVKEQRLADQVGASYDGIARGPGMFMVEATPAHGKTVAEVEAALKAELARIASEGVTEEELARVKAQVIAADVYQRDSGFYQAMQIGEIVTAGLPLSLLDERVEKLRAVSAEQVKAAAAAVFRDDTLNVAVLDPQPVGDQPRKPRGDVHAR